MAKVIKTRRLKTDPATVELALNQLAMQGGNYSATSRVLEERYGITVKPLTLSNWVNGVMQDRYLELVEEHETIARQVAAEKATSIAAEAADGAQRLVAETMAQMDQIEPRHLAPSARNLAQVHSSMTDKALLLRGQPTEIRKLESLDELVDVLAGLGVIEGEAIEEAEIVASDQPDSLPAP